MRLNKWSHLTRNFFFTMFAIKLNGPLNNLHENYAAVRAEVIDLAIPAQLTFRAIIIIVMVLPIPKGCIKVLVVIVALVPNSTRVETIQICTG